MSSSPKQIPSIIEEGPLKGASIPAPLWNEINGEDTPEPLDLEAIDKQREEGNV